MGSIHSSSKYGAFNNRGYTVDTVDLSMSAMMFDEPIFTLIALIGLILITYVFSNDSF